MSEGRTPRQVPSEAESSLRRFRFALVAKDVEFGFQGVDFTVDIFEFVCIRGAEVPRTRK